MESIEVMIGGALIDVAFVFICIWMETRIVPRRKEAWSSCGEVPSSLWRESRKSNQASWLGRNWWQSQGADKKEFCGNNDLELYNRAHN